MYALCTSFPIHVSIHFIFATDACVQGCPNFSGISVVYSSTLRIFAVSMACMRFKSGARDSLSSADTKPAI